MPKASIAGFSARHSPQPSEEKTASPIRPRRSSSSPNSAASALRAPISGPSCATSSAPRGATDSRSIPTSRAEREHDDGERRRARAARTRARSRASPRSSGPPAAAAARARAPPQARPPVPPKRSRPAPSRRSTRTEHRCARPAIAATCTRARAGHQQRPGRRRGRPTRRRRRPRSRARRAINPAHTAHAARGARIPYVASAARADAPPTSFSPAAETSTSPRTRQTTTETIDGREGNSIRARPDASSAPSHPQEMLRSRGRLGFRIRLQASRGQIVGRLFVLTVSFLTIPNEPGLVTVTVRTVPARNDLLRNGVRVTCRRRCFFVKTTGLLLALDLLRRAARRPCTSRQPSRRTGCPLSGAALKTVDAAADGKPKARASR